MFTGNKKAEASTIGRNRNTFIAPQIELNGNLKGEGAVQIEGTLHGDITVTSVVIGEYGVVNGTINAKNVIVNGKLNGAIFCESLEIMKNGTISNEIKVKEILISGRVDGSIEAKEDINIDTTGEVNASTMQAKNIMVSGAFKGEITAYELLEITSTGSVEGDITVKNIKTHEGGKLLGSMQIYEAPNA